MAYYVGCKEGGREVFSHPVVPTYESHGHLYNASIGPFRTKAGADFMARYGAGNPHCVTVSDAERLARLYRDRSACPR